jgi:hypothetical protein
MSDIYLESIQAKDHTFARCVLGCLLKVQWYLLILIAFYLRCAECDLIRRTTSRGKNWIINFHVIRSDHTSFSIYRHLRTHTGERPYKVSESS